MYVAMCVAMCDTLLLLCVLPLLLVETHSLGTLRTILSTGSPLKPQSYDYVYRYIKKDVLLGSISGMCVHVQVCACVVVCMWV